MGLSRVPMLRALVLLASLLLLAVWSRPAADAGGILGDANCDGQVNPLDSAFILQYSAGLIATVPCANNADVDGSGSVNPVDSALILQFSAGLFNESVPPASVAPATTIRTCIASDFEGWSGETVFELCNGQVWIQSSYAYTYHYAYRPDVVITFADGHHTMTVEGVSGSIEVEQITDFIRSCISSDFDGWDGDTVFELCNGQTWQQAAYSYRYHYAYRPDVLIYWTGGEYRMSVEGMDDTIAVMRL